MQVILLKDVPKLGRRGDVKNVSDSYAMNLLFPRGLAQVATPQAIAGAQKRREEAAAAEQQAAAEIVARVRAADGARFEIRTKTDKTGHLYQKIDAAKIAVVVGVPVASIALPHPLKEVGEHAVEINFEKVKGVATIAIVAD